MKHQGISATALMLIFLLVMAVPARASVLHFADVVYMPASTGAASDVRLRIAPQSGTSTIAPQQSIQRGGAAGTPQQSGANAPAGGSTTPNDATLSQSGGQVETVDLGDVTGTVCDCGEIPSAPEIPGGGFPFWPFLGLVAIPLAFIPGGDEVVPFVIPAFRFSPSARRLVASGPSFVAGLPLIASNFLQEKGFARRGSPFLS